LKSTQKHLSPLEITLMERRFQRMKHNDLVSKYRREAKATNTSKGSQWATKKVAEIRASEAAGRSGAKAGAIVAKVKKPHVVVRAPFESSSDIPFKYMSIVFEVGATIGSRVALDNRSETLAGENIPSLMLSISKLGTDDYKVYPSFEAAKSAADNDNTALNAYMRTLAKAKVAA